MDKKTSPKQNNPTKVEKSPIIGVHRNWRCCGCGRWAIKEGESQAPSHCCKMPWNITPLKTVDHVIDSMKEEGKFDSFSEAVMEDMRRNIKDKLDEEETIFQTSKWRFRKKRCFLDG